MAVKLTGRSNAKWHDPGTMETFVKGTWRPRAACGTTYTGKPFEDTKRAVNCTLCLQALSEPPRDFNLKVRLRTT